VSTISSSLQLLLKLAVINGSFTSNLHSMAVEFNDSILVHSDAISVSSYGMSMHYTDPTSSSTKSNKLSTYYIIADATLGLVIVLLVIVCCCCVGYFFFFRNLKLLPKIIRDSRKSIIKPQVEVEELKSYDVEDSMENCIEMVPPSAPPAPSSLIVALREMDTTILALPETKSLNISVGDGELQRTHQVAAKNYEEHLEPHSLDDIYIDI